MHSIIIIIKFFLTDRQNISYSLRPLLPHPFDFNMTIMGN